MIAGLVKAGAAMAGVIVGSAHDFTSGAGASKNWVSTEEICIVCHATHGDSNLDGSSGLLWNRADATTSSYILYSNTATMSSAPAQPSGTSKLCLGCHDGTVAIDSYGDVTGTNKLTSADRQYIGTDLSNDHPISLAYPATSGSGGNRGVRVPSTPISAADWGGSVDTTIGESFLEGGKVECQSCHDVHARNVYSDAPGDALLLVDNTGSKLCLTCHIK
jgi:hypothetical protein